MGGTLDSCAPIVEAFLVECPELMSGLGNALKRKDAPEVARLAHALKGAISNFTQDAAFQSCVRLELLAKEADFHRAPDAFKRLEADVDALLNALKMFVGGVAKA
jgi:two-component system sensor histidine kinase/response regulator